MVVSKRELCPGDAAGKIIYFLWRRRTLFLAITPIVLLMLAKPSPILFWGGVPMVAAGQAIRIWSAGYLLKLHSLVTAGPFGMSRNPLYIGSFIGSLGYFTMCGRPELAMAGVVLFWIFHGGAIAFEERLLRREYGAEFEEYCRSTPRFLLRLRGFSGNGEFSWKMVAYNREYRSAVGVAVLTAIFGLVSYYPALAPAEWILG